MPKKYSETEKTNIRRDLRRAAQRSLFHKGVRGTSVENLVRQAAIPKATFYLFYRTKEDLYIDVLTDFRTTMQDEMLSMLQELDEKADLIERRRQGQGRPSLIYVKTFMDALG